MAEFIEVVRQYARMCNKNNCNICPMREIVNPDDSLCEDFVLYEGHAAEAEKIIMDWANDNPEPQYPTWEEWQRERFPSADNPVHPCTFISKEQAGCNGKINCNDCRNEPIPADIAEKLGIKPEGVE